MSDYSNPGVCPQCGEPIAENARFCENCGASFPVGSAAGAADNLGANVSDAYNSAQENIPTPDSGMAPDPGYGAAPGGYGPGPEGYGAAPGGYGAGPEGYGAAPGGYGAGPEGGYGAGPGGYGAAPGGYGAAPGGYGGGDGSGSPGGYGGGYGYGYRAPAKPILPDSPIRRYIEGFCGSPLFLTFVILITSKIVFEFFGNFTSILTNAPLIVICVGLWILFANSKSHKVTTSPLSLIRGGLIAEMVLSIIGSAFSILFGIFLFITSMALTDSLSNSSDTYGNDLAAISGILPAIIFVFILVMVITLIISILFYRGLIGTTNSVKDMLVTGHGNPVIPNVARVLFIIQIILGAVGLLWSFATLAMRSVYHQALYELFNESGLSSSFLDGFLYKSSLSTACSIIASIISIAILVIALMIIGNLESTRFDAAPMGYGPGPDSYGR